MKFGNANAHGRMFITCRWLIGLMILFGGAAIVLGLPARAQDDAAIAAGLEIWKSTGCTTCHGNFAEGGGGGKRPSGPDLRSSKLDRETIVATITVGRRQMPAFDGILLPDEIQSLGTFLAERIVGGGKVDLEECTAFFGLYQGAVHPKCRKYE